MTTMKIANAVLRRMIEKSYEVLMIARNQKNRVRTFKFF